MTTIPISMKTLTRIRLINWHYFTDETISLNGSCLFSGHNASGKSTILDALQLVLTTNSRRFNPAANEKSKRDLRGYVRCKTGDEGRTFCRQGAVIAYVALEFFEDKKQQYFVIGTKLDSPDEESSIVPKWFYNDGRLEDFTFLKDDRPALDEQFFCKGRKVRFYNQNNEARENFKRRLGNLEPTFFEMIPKALAFKPMDNVRNFITRYLLRSSPIDVESLRENILHYRGLLELIAKVKKQIEQLNDIAKTNQELQDTDEKILVIDLLLQIAEQAQRQADHKRHEDRRRQAQKDLSAYEEKSASLQSDIASRREEHQAILVAIAANNNAHLLEQLRSELAQLQKDTKIQEESLSKLKKHVRAVKQTLPLLEETQLQLGEVRQKAGETKLQSRDAQQKAGETQTVWSAAKLDKLTEASVDMSERCQLADRLEDLLKRHKQDNLRALVYAQQKIEDYTADLQKLESELEKLKQNRLVYPNSTVTLQREIQAQFKQMGIEAPVHIFADLLEIARDEWRDAAEGYLNTQRFSLLVEPKYYDIAARVYERKRRELHSVLLVNTAKLEHDTVAPYDSLAAVVSCQDREGRAYANYLLGRVKLCAKVEDLKEHKTAITASCMLYQGHALRHIDPKIYNNPYIGKQAIVRQIEIKEQMKRDLQDKLRQAQQTADRATRILSALESCRIDVIKDLLNAPHLLLEIQQKQKDVTAKINDIENNDPQLLEQRMLEDQCRRKIAELELNHTNLIREIGIKQGEINQLRQDIARLAREVEAGREDLEAERREWAAAYLKAEEKFAKHQRDKSADVISVNNQPRRKALVNEKTKIIAQLVKLQTQYQSGELGSGTEAMPKYYEELRRLESGDLVRFSADFQKAQALCEKEFRENFLVKMRENILYAQTTFKELNQALKGITYGSDRYEFICSYNRDKAKLYEMITSEFNVGSDSLFSDSFDNEYHEEMEALFAKISVDDTSGIDTIQEYTDYRTYMDYDIKVMTTDGKVQLFSKIYREKSGGETQTPYYVAIAASFKQIYNLGESIRIIMLDEAFDKMDDRRIASMMELYNKLQLQVILATPPSKMDLLRDYVGTVNIVKHLEDGSNTSIVWRADREVRRNDSQ